MTRLIKLECNKSYVSEENAIKAFEKKFGNTEQRYIIMKTDDGRFFPVALGMEALQRGIHFHFNVLG